MTVVSGVDMEEVTAGEWMQRRRVQGVPGTCPDIESVDGGLAVDDLSVMRKEVVTVSMEEISQRNLKSATKLTRRRRLEAPVTVLSLKKPFRLCQGPLNIPIKVGYRFWAFRALGGGPKLAQKRVSGVDWYPTSQKFGCPRVVEGWTLVSDL